MYVIYLFTPENIDSCFFELDIVLLLVLMGGFLNILTDYLDLHGSVIDVNVTAVYVSSVLCQQTLFTEQ